MEDITLTEEEAKQYRIQPPKNNICFDNVDLVFEENGDILLKGRKIANDKELLNALRENFGLEKIELKASKEKGTNYCYKHNCKLKICEIHGYYFCPKEHERTIKRNIYIA